MAALLCACGGGVDPDWPQFRGPDGLGVSAARDLPTRWAPESANIGWRTAIPGLGHSSPVVAGGRVFVSTAVIKRRNPRTSERFVLGLDLATGELLWQTKIFEGLTGPRHWMNQGVSPTPVTDGDTVFAYFGSILVALDRDGNILWQREVQPDPVPGATYGPGSSLILTDQGVVVMRDREGKWEVPGWIGSFDRGSGEPLWRDQWEHTCCSYSTPVLLPRPGGVELVRYDGKEVVAYDPDSGERLWSAEHPSTQTVPSLSWKGDLLVLPGSMHTRKLIFMRLDGSGPETRTEVLAEHRQGVPELASPVLVNGLLFTVTRRGVLSCYDAETGERLWQERLKGEYVSSLVAGDGKVYATSKAGLTYVVVAERDFRVLAENEIGGTVLATAAIAGGCLLLRTSGDLVCVRQEQAAA